MSCEELRDDYGAYALGVADDPERSEIGAHLARRCPICVPGVQSALGTVSALSGSVKLSDPPARLRRRVVAMIAPERARGKWLPWLAWAPVAAAVLAFLVLQPWEARQRAANLERELALAKQGSAKLQQALAILNDPVTRDVTFGAPAARGRVFVSPNGVMLIAANLPKLGAGKTFELWVIPNGANPLPAGTFQSQPDSSAVYIHEGPVQNAAVIAVTVEPAGGSPQPTTTPFIVAKL